MEKHITIPNGKETIAACIDEQSDMHAIVIMHPHSLMGGNMDNPIVQTAQQVFASKGLSTVRFNFRGVGYSTGVFDDGIGEQDDLKAVISFLKTKGIYQIDLIGYSFGSWVLAHAAQTKLDYSHAMMISPPIAFMDFSEIQQFPNLIHVVTGSRDTYAPPDLIKKFLTACHSEAQLDIIEGADHFYSSYMLDIEKIFNRWHI
ncbi:MAG: alpha/beta hydrolase [Candidatus Magnetomorum sp.]|nr:alpha/beta hydrolase [Candidatus Magnetomorum sp.]